MSSEEKRRANVFLQFAMTPVHVLKKARGFYMKGCDGCAGKVANGGVVPSYGAPVFTKSFSFHSSDKARDKDLSDLFEVGASKSLAGRVDMNKKIRPATDQEYKPLMRGNQGVGKGKMKRIDEDETCSFKSEPDDHNGGSLHLQKLHAVDRTCINNK